MYSLAKTPDTAKAAVNTACGSGAGNAAGPLCRRSTTGPGRTAGGYGYCTLKTEIPKSITWEDHLEPLLTFLGAVLGSFGRMGVGAGGLGAFLGKLFGINESKCFAFSRKISPNLGCRKCVARL